MCKAMGDRDRFGGHGQRGEELRRGAYGTRIEEGSKAERGILMERNAESGVAPTSQCTARGA